MEKKDNAPFIYVLIFHYKMILIKKIESQCLNGSQTNKKMFDE